MNKLLFSGRRKPAKWKRPILLVSSGVFAVGISIVLVITWQQPGPWAYTLALLGTVGLGASSLAVLVALRGCDACIAKLLGGF